MPELFNIRDFKTKMDKIRQQVPETSKRILDEIIIMVGDLRKKNTSLNKIIINQDKTLKENEKTINESIETEKRLQTTIDKNEAIVTSLDNELTEKQELINTLQARNTIFKDSINDHKEEIEKLRKEVTLYKTKIGQLTTDYNKYKELYEGIKAQKSRPVATPTQLSTSFKKAFESMKEELQTSENSAVEYVISSFDISLKTGIGIDQNDDVSFQLPKEDEISTPENLSTIQFSIKSVPKQ